MRRILFILQFSEKCEGDSNFSLPKDAFYLYIWALHDNISLWETLKSKIPERKNKYKFLG